MTKQTPWPYDAIFLQPTVGVEMQKLITYKRQNRKLIRETVTRRFYGADDYQDSVSTEVICDAAD